MKFPANQRRSRGVKLEEAGKADFVDGEGNGRGQTPRMEECPHLCLGNTATELRDNSTDVLVLITVLCLIFFTLTNFEPERTWLMSRSRFHLIRVLRPLTNTYQG